MSGDRLPIEILQLIGWERWGSMKRRERIDSLANVIVGIFMQDKLVLNKRDTRIIAELDRIRRKEAMNNWVKPKYED